MGEPAIPDASDRANAAALANTLLDYIRDDEPMPSLDDAQVWLLAGSLAWAFERITRRIADIEILAERMFDAAQLERFRREGGILERWTAIGQARRDDWIAAARAARAAGG